MFLNIEVLPGGYLVTEDVDSGEMRRSIKTAEEIADLMYKGSDHPIGEIFWECVRAGGHIYLPQQQKMESA